MFKTLRQLPVNKLIEVTRSRFRFFWSHPVYDELQPEDFKACALAALEGLRDFVGHNFASPHKAHSDVAIGITKRIFEKQTLFNPMDDKAFCDKAADLCQYFVLQYISPWELPRYDDYTPDVFAACFATDKVLYLQKRGWDFRPDDLYCAASDLGNHRLFLQYCNKNGRYICGDASMGIRYQNKSSKKPEPPEAYGLHLDLQIDEETGCYAYTIPGSSMYLQDFTKADLLRLVNLDSFVQYERIEIVC